MTTHPNIDQYQYFPCSRKFEKLMYSRLYKFLYAFEIFDPLQLGFRENHSTTQTLLWLSESIKKSIDNDRFGCGVFLGGRGRGRREIRDVKSFPY